MHGLLSLYCFLILKDLDRTSLKYVSSILVYLFYSGYLLSQSPQFINYSVNDGLPGSETYRVHKDSKGYIWVVGDMGVSRFDGYRFQNFTTEDGLPDNTVLGIYEDHKKRLWFWTLTGELAYYSDGKIHPLTKVNRQLKKYFTESSGIINAIGMDKHNILHIGAFNISGIFKVFFDGNKQELMIDFKSENGYYVQETGLSGEAIGTLQIKSEKTGSVQSLENSFYQQLDKMGKLKHRIKIVKNWHNPKTEVIILKSGKTLIAFNETVYEISNNKFIPLFTSPNLIIHLKEDKNGNIWVGTIKDGIFFFENGDFRKIKEHYLSGKSVSSVTFDHENGVWFSTLENGIFYFPYRNFKHYTMLNGLLNENIYSIAIDHKGVIWCGTLNGEIYSISSNRAETHSLKFAREKSFRVHSILDKKDVLFGTSVGIFKFHDNQLQHIYPIVQYSISLMSSKFGKSIWTGGYGTFARLNEKEHQEYQSRFRVNTLIEESKSILWLGSTVGLWRFQNEKLTFYGQKNPILSTRIDGLEFGHRALWIATKGKGLVIKQGNTLIQIDTKKGLIDDNCKFVHIDQDGDVWVSTNKGISRIHFPNKGDLKKFVIQNLSENNGLISNEVNKLVVKNRTAYIATNKGISIIHKNNVRANKIPPLMHFTQTKVNNRPIPLKRKFQLPHDQNTIRIDYVGLCYKTAGKVKYRYRLCGLDTNWTQTEHTNLNFTTLPYGDYRFEIQARNNDGFWNQYPKIIRFTILPPFWHTWWFRVLIGLAFISATIGTIRYRVRIVENREKEKFTLLQRASEMEMKFLSAQMNPHFTFNAMNSIQHFLLSNDPKKAQHYLVKYSQLIRKVLENNMDSFVSLDEELNMIELYMEIESMRFSPKFDFDINICPKLEETDIKIPPMMIQPYIENAIWHGVFHQKEKRGNILLFVELVENDVKCTIEDNGVGRNRSSQLKIDKEHRSVGMLITQQRLLKLQSDMELRVNIIDLMDNSGNPSGTKVEIWLPFQLGDKTN